MPRTRSLPSCSTVQSPAHADCPSYHEDGDQPLAYPAVSRSSDVRLIGVRAAHQNIHEKLAPGWQQSPQAALQTRLTRRAVWPATAAGPFAPRVGVLPTTLVCVATRTADVPLRAAKHPRTAAQATRHCSCTAQTRARHQPRLLPSSTSPAAIASTHGRCTCNHSSAYCCTAATCPFCRGARSCEI